MRLSTIIACALLVSACTIERESYEPLPSPQLIDVYITMTALDFNFFAQSRLLQLFDTKNKIVLGAEKDALIAKYDDTHFNEPIFHGKYSSFANEFTDITVTSDAEFNGVKPGDNLGGQIRIISVSPYKWLMSKGALTYDWTFVPSDDYNIVFAEYAKGAFTSHYHPQNHPVNKVLTSLTPDDLLLLSTRCLYLVFSKAPEVKAHNLTVSFHDGANVFSATKAVVFE